MQYVWVEPEKFMSEEETGDVAVYHCHDSGCLRHYHHQISLQRDRQIPCLGRHYRRGGEGYTWLDAALDVVGEHGYTILSDNGDGDGPAAIFINDETLASIRELIDRLCQIGRAIDTATGSDLERLDEEAAEIDGILSDLLVSLLVDAGLVEPLVVSEGS